MFKQPTCHVQSLDSLALFLNANENLHVKFGSLLDSLDSSDVLESKDVFSFDFLNT